MTTLFETLIGESYTTVFKDANHNIRHRHYRNVLRSKENIYKNNCKKNLKRKLKKYKLRQDGKEDQDIIDVSDSLVSSLVIRSPNKLKDSVELKEERLKPKNYLFRMVRRKQTTLKTSKVSQSSDKKIKVLDKNATTSMSPATEEKKATNAFKLLMDSRNKSIGTNSPGKEKPNDEAELQELSEKKSIKAKRNLMLQKMSEEKGSLKKKEMEKQHEKYIIKKMEKRAEKLKSMILHKEPKPVIDEEKKSTLTRSPLDSIDTEKNGKVLDKSLNTLQLVNMFNETANKKTSSKNKLSKEDEEFLDKLSPSIRKKESMLSYFKKIEKDSECTHVDAENDNVIIKVKLGSKTKKRHKKKLSLNKNFVENTDVLERLDVNSTSDSATIEVKEVDNQVNKDTESIVSESSAKRRKRKREANESTPCRDSPIVSDTTDDIRPKRTVKRPVKYSDNVALTSSDEELHIFTPKKKKPFEGKNISVPKATDIIVIKDDAKTKPDKKLDSNEKNSKKEKKPSKNAISTKSVKLAPIFSKTQPDAAVIEAKQKFLQSGVPEQLKKLMSKQKDCSTISNSFPIVVHVQQLHSTQPLSPAIKVSEESYHENFNLDNSEDVFAKMLNLKTSQSAEGIQCKNNVNTQTALQNLKESYPRFPVYRIYKLLRGKKKGEYRDSNIFSNSDNSIEILNCSIDMQSDNPDQLTWSDKYKPLSGNEIIGNFESIKELKKWLVTWTENDRKTKVIKLNDSDSSDYYQSDPDSRDSMKSNNNLLVLSGPVGCGKTSGVYAVAAELSMKVIEVNASSKRNGKIMLQDLQEATQSHKVNRGAGSSENSQKTQENVEPVPEIKVKKRGRPKKVVEMPNKLVKEKFEISNGVSASQESTRTAMSLILIDDADIIFDQDDGFCSAITQLVQISKRPVILVTGSLTLPHLQKFIQSSKILRMKSLLPNMLGTWLDLMCLADSGACWPGLGAKVLNFFNGDIRRTINCLQFYVGSQEQVLSLETNSQTDSQMTDERISVDDENSCMSWRDSDVIDDKNKNGDRGTDSQPIWDTFLDENIHLKHMKCPLKMFHVWWNIPKILANDLHKRNDQEECDNTPASLDSISNVLDSISISDFLSHKRPETEATMTSNPWYDAECDSVSELENLDHYDQKHDITRRLCSDLVIGSITAAQEIMGLENRYDLDFPGMSAKR